MNNAPPLPSGEMDRVRGKFVGRALGRLLDKRIYKTSPLDLPLHICEKRDSRGKID